MRDLSPHHITSSQLMFIITGAQMGSAMLALPALVCKEAGHQGWMAVLLGALIPYTSIYVIERLGKRLPDLNFVQLNQALLGKIGGSLGVLVFVVWGLLFEALLINAFARLINIYLLPQTPLWATIFMSMFCVWYAGSKGGTVVGRINETLFFGILISLLFIFLPVNYSNDITNLLPLTEINPPGLLKGALFAAYAYAGTEVLLVMYSQVRDKEKLLRAGFEGVTITMVIYILVVVACILVFGADRTTQYLWPGVTILKIANIAVVERLEFYFLAIWAGIVLRRVINLTFSAALTIAQLFGDENRHSLAMLGMSAGIYILSLQIKKIQVDEQLIPYAVGGYLLIGAVYPLFLLAVSWIRKGEANANV